MRITKKILSLAFALGVLSTAAQAATESECAIWLCLPAGFPSGCGEAKAAFRHRIKHLKPPLPDFASCSIGGDAHTSTMHAKDGYAALIGRRNPPSIIKDAGCISHLPAGCTQTIRYVDAFVGGKKLGETYYFDETGTEISVP